MISNQKIGEALGRLSVMKWFPTNSYALVTVAEIIRELCPDEGEVSVLVQEMVNTADEWPGPLSLRNAYTAILERRKIAEKERIQAERRKEARRERDEHEVTCHGYYVRTDDSRQTVQVEFCNQPFGEYNFAEFAHCRKGNSLRAENPEFCKLRMAEELAMRPGWVSAQEYRTLRTIGGSDRASGAGEFDRHQLIVMVEVMREPSCRPAFRHWWVRPSSGDRRGRGDAGAVVQLRIPALVGSTVIR